MENWKYIRDYDNMYQISDLGRVRSFKRYPEGKILTQNEDSHGYLIVGLCKNGNPKTKRIHTLMYEAFNNYKLKKDECVHHIDFTKNDFLENFEVMTKGEHRKLHTKGEYNPFYNKNHSEKTKKLMRENHADFKGENGPTVILTNEKVISIRRLCDEGILKYKQIANKFNVSVYTISDIKLRKTWKHI